MPRLLEASAPRRVAVFRALQLGDLLCAVPALRALRAAAPLADITLVGLPWAASFAARFRRYVDAHLAFPGYPGLPEQPPHAGRFARFVAEARARRFDLALQMHGDGRITNAIVRELGASAVAGFSSEKTTSECLRYPGQGSEVHRLLTLVQWLGAAPRGEALEFPLGAEDRAEYAPFAASRRLPSGRCLCLHPGARALERRWPPAAFARVGDDLHRRFGLPVVITGSEAERPLAAEVARLMRAPAANAAGPISIGALAVQIARAALLVTNDTGVSHIAAALGVPSVVVFRASDVERWAPLDRSRHRVVWDPRGSAAEEVLAEACQCLMS